MHNQCQNIYQQMSLDDWLINKKFEVCKTHNTSKHRYTLKDDL